MDSGLLLSLLEPVAAEYCNQTVNLSRMMTNDHNNDYKKEDNDQMIITLKHNKRLKKETLFMWIMKELLR